MLHAEFIAAAQVVVYAGAVMVLYVFVAAYVGGVEEPIWEPIAGQRFLAPLLAGALFIELSIAILGTGLKAIGSEGPTIPAGFGSPAPDRRAAARAVPDRVRGRVDPAADRGGRARSSWREGSSRSRRSSVEEVAGSGD